MELLAGRRRDDRRIYHRHQGPDLFHCSRCYEPAERHPAATRTRAWAPRLDSRNVRNGGRGASETRRAGKHKRPTQWDAPQVHTDGEEVAGRYVFLNASDEYGNDLGSIGNGTDVPSTRECLDFWLGLRHAERTEPEPEIDAKGRAKTRADGSILYKKNPDGSVKHRPTPYAGKQVMRVHIYFGTYDFTQALHQVEMTAKGLLLRPELRIGSGGSHWPIIWVPDDVAAKTIRYRLNYLRNRWSIARERYDAKAPCLYRTNHYDKHDNLVHKKGSPVLYASGKPKMGDWKKEASVVIWDWGSHHQCRFDDALKDWNVGTADERAFITRMKDGRPSWKKWDPEIGVYCKDENRLGAQLCRALDNAWVSGTGKHLRLLHGPGSMAGDLMDHHKVPSFNKEPPQAMQRALLEATIGGNFQYCRQGEIEGPVYIADERGAYLGGLSPLPCLTCGRWREVKGRTLRRSIADARLALVEVRVGKSQHARPDWGPYLLRTSTSKKNPSAMSSSIISPSGGFVARVWKEEFLATEKHFEQCEAISAWVYDTTCDCRPFGFLEKLYRQRVELGADTAGRALKLAGNSVGGRLWQTVGVEPRFQSLTWASNMTSRIRATLWESLDVVKEHWGVIGFATDSVMALRPLKDGLEKASKKRVEEIGTDDLPEPLGSWKCSAPYDEGVLILRPGLSFPIAVCKLVEDIQRAGIKREEFQTALRSADYEARWEPYKKEVHSRGYAKLDLLWNAPKLRAWVHDQWKPLKKHPETDEQLWWCDPFTIDNPSTRFISMRAGTRLQKTPQRATSYAAWRTLHEGWTQDEDGKPVPPSPAFDDPSGTLGKWVAPGGEGGGHIIKMDPRPKREGAYEDGRLALRSICSPDEIRAFEGKREGQQLELDQRCMHNYAVGKKHGTAALGICRPFRKGEWVRSIPFDKTKHDPFTTEESFYDAEDARNSGQPEGGY